MVSDRPVNNCQVEQVVAIRGTRGSQASGYDSAFFLYASPVSLRLKPQRTRLKLVVFRQLRRLKQQEQRQRPHSRPTGGTAVWHSAPEEQHPHARQETQVCTSHNRARHITHTHNPHDPKNQPCFQSMRPNPITVTPPNFCHLSTHDCIGTKPWVHRRALGRAAPA